MINLVSCDTLLKVRQDLRYRESRLIDQTKLSVITASIDVLSRAPDVPQPLSIQAITLVESFLMSVNQDGDLSSVIAELSGVRERELMAHNPSMRL